MLNFSGFTITDSMTNRTINWHEDLTNASMFSLMMLRSEIRHCRWATFRLAGRLALVTRNRPRCVFQKDYSRQSATPLLLLTRLASKGQHYSSCRW